jgi:hypothetical protein
MEAICHPFFGLEDREACIAFRKSLLMLANSFRVGTFFSSSRFCFGFKGKLLNQLGSDLKSNGHALRLVVSKPFDCTNKFVSLDIVWPSCHGKKLLIAVLASIGESIEFLYRNVQNRVAMRAGKFDANQIPRFNDYSLSCCHFASMVIS